MMPQFKSQVPEHLLHGKPESERWIYEQLSIQGQQNGHLSDQNNQILTRLGEGDAHFTKHADEIQRAHKRIDDYDRIKTRLTGGKIVVVWILCAILGPLALVFIGSFFTGWFEHIFSKK